MPLHAADGALRKFGLLRSIRPASLPSAAAAAAAATTPGLLRPGRLDLIHRGLGAQVQLPVRLRDGVFKDFDLIHAVQNPETVFVPLVISQVKKTDFTAHFFFQLVKGRTDGDLGGHPGRGEPKVALRFLHGGHVAEGPHAEAGGNWS